MDGRKAAKNATSSKRARLLGNARIRRDDCGFDIEKTKHHTSTASESAVRGRQIVEGQGWKFLEEDKSENTRNVP